MLFSASTAQILFSEDFEGESNGATTGTGAGGTWSANSPGGTFSRQSAVRNSFLVNNNNSQGVWTSNVIDISAAGYAILDITIGAAGFGFSGDEYVRAYYILDNSGTEVLWAEGLGSIISSTVNGSAIIAGNSVQLVVRAFDNSSSFFLDGALDFDDVTVTAATVLYSRKSGTWTDMSSGFGGTGTWSANASGTPACGCVPLNDVVAVIRNGHTVTLPTSQTATGGSGTANLAPGAVEIRSGGILRYNVSGVTLGIQGGLLIVKGGGTINSSGGGITGETISFNADVGGGAVFEIETGGTVAIENLTIGTDASTLHSIIGDGTLSIANDVTIIADGATLTNNLSTPVSITDRIQFPSGTANSNFVNNQTITAGSIFFDNSNNDVINSGSLTIQSIGVNNAADDGNVVTNSGTLTLSSIANSIDTNSSNFFINNSGTILQDGNFADLVDASNFINMPTGVWRWSKNANTIAANLADVLDCSAVGNTFYYDGTSNQTIAPIPYYHLILTNGGNKSFSATLDVNGDLDIETNTTSAGGANALDIEGDLTITGTGVLAGSGDINLRGNWSAVNAGSYLEGSRIVTFDGIGTQIISNDAGAETFANLRLNTGAAANVVSLQHDITVSQTLTLTRGRLLLNGNALYVTNSSTAAIVNGSANSFVVSESTTAPYSRIIWTTGSANGTFTFPFGTTGGSYIPYALGKSVGAGAAGTVSVATYSTAPNNTPYPNPVTNLQDANGDDQSAVVVDRFWIVNTSGYSTLTATQNLTFTAAEGAASATPRAAQRWNGVNTWDTKVGNSAANPFPVPSTNLAASSIWVVVSNAVSLPVEWLDFDVQLQNHEVHISWETAMESNNDYFTVERAQDIENFETVQVVDGKGSSSDISGYSVIDPAPLYGTTYYRIKQTDFDGTVSHTDLRKLVYDGPQFAVLDVFPNPGNGESMNVQITGLKSSKEVNFEILNSQGVVVFHKVLAVKNSGSVKEEVWLPARLSPGFYIVKAGQTAYLTRKFVVE